MWTPIVNILIQVVLPVVVTGVGGILAYFLVALARKGIKYLAAKWDLDISEKEEKLIDGIIETAVRAAEESSKVSKIPSNEKEDMAVSIAKNELGNSVTEQSLRSKIKARVSTLFH